jgi:Ca2+-binding EF-hand superfamily protein
MLKAIDNSLNEDEFKSAFKEFDVNGDGNISYMEFIGTLEKFYN